MIFIKFKFIYFLLVTIIILKGVYRPKIVLKIKLNCSKIRYYKKKYNFLIYFKYIKKNIMLNIKIIK